MENANPQEDRAALAKAAMLRRQGAKKGGKAKSEAVLCAKRGGQEGEKQGQSGEQERGASFDKGGFEKWILIMVLIKLIESCFAVLFIVA